MEQKNPILHPVFHPGVHVVPHSGVPKPAISNTTRKPGIKPAFVSSSTNSPVVSINTPQTSGILSTNVAGSNHNGDVDYQGQWEFDPKSGLISPAKHNSFGNKVGAGSSSFINPYSDGVIGGPVVSDGQQGLLGSGGGSLLPTDGVIMSSGEVATSGVDSGHVLTSAEPGGYQILTSAEPTGNIFTSAEPGGQIVTSAESGGQKVTSAESPSNHISNSAEPGGQIVTSAESGGQIVTSAESGGQIMTSAESPSNHISNSVEPAGQIMTSAEPGGHNILSSAEPTGNILTSAEPGGQQILNSAEPGGQQILNSAAPGGQQILNSAEPVGQKILTSAEPTGNILTSAEPAGHHLLTSVEPAGQIVTSGEHSGQTQHSAEPADHLLTSADPPGQTPQPAEPPGSHQLPPLAQKLAPTDQLENANSLESTPEDEFEYILEEIEDEPEPPATPEVSTPSNILHPPTETPNFIHHQPIQNNIPPNTPNGQLLPPHMNYNGRPRYPYPMIPYGQPPPQHNSFGAVEYPFYNNGQMKIHHNVKNGMPHTNGQFGGRPPYPPFFYGNGNKQNFPYINQRPVLWHPQFGHNSSGVVGEDFFGYL